MSEKKKKKRVGSTIFRIILIIIAGLTVGIGVFTWNASGILGNKLPMPFGFGVSVIMSPSMEPVLHTNDLAFVTEEESYQIDDIVVFQEGNMLVIHRIISIDGDTVITKGDANNVPDEPMTMDRIKAKLQFHIPFVGLIFKYLKTVPGTLIVLFLAIFLLYRSRQKERDADREELEDIVEEIKRLRKNIAENSVELKDASTAKDAGKPSVNTDSKEAEDSVTDTTKEAGANISEADSASEEAEVSVPTDHQETVAPDVKSIENDGDTSAKEDK